MEYLNTYDKSKWHKRQDNNDFTYLVLFILCLSDDPFITKIIMYRSSVF